MGETLILVLIVCAVYFIVLGVQTAKSASKIQQLADKVDNVSTMEELLDANRVYDRIKTHPVLPSHFALLEAIRLSLKDKNRLNKIKLD